MVELIQHFEILVQTNNVMIGSYKVWCQFPFLLNKKPSSGSLEAKSLESFESI